MEDVRSTSADGRKRAREGDTSGWFDPIESPEVKRLREDLLQGFFDDSDPEPAAQDLDSFILSLQKEISTAPMTQAVEVVDLTSESGSEELGYLLGASDDDLGLPPRLWPDVIDDVWSRAAEQAGAPYDSLWGLEGHVDAYDDGLWGFGGGASCGSHDWDEGYESVAFNGGLFEYSDVRFDLSDELSDLNWRRGNLRTQ